LYSSAFEAPAPIPSEELLFILLVAIPIYEAPLGVCGSDAILEGFWNLSIDDCLWFSSCPKFDVFYMCWDEEGLYINSFEGAMKAFSSRGGFEKS
jgi:hypothetical protein